jgi:toxin CptA
MANQMGAKAREHKYSEASCEISLAPSRWAARTLTLATLATLALIAATPGALALRILAATWIACAALEALHSRALLRGRRGVRAVSLSGGGEIAVRDALGRWRSGRLRAGSFVAPWLTVIRWRPAEARFDRAIPILPDMLAAEEFRRLRVLLRWS